MLKLISRTFKTLLSILFIISLMPLTALGKWKSLGFEDAWNNSLFNNGGSANIRSFSSDNKNNHHLLVTISGYYYLNWNGKSWSGLEDENPTELSFLKDSYADMKTDSYNNPHFIFNKKVDQTKRTLNYIFWDGKGWTEENVIIATDSSVDEYFLSNIPFAFTLDDNNKPHVIYNITNKQTNNRYLYYRFYQDGIWKTFDGADKDKGILKEIDGIDPNNHFIDLDSYNFPHVILQINQAVFPSYSGKKHYVFWNGTEWTGIDDSHTLSGGLPLSLVSDKSSSTGHYFHIDKKDQLHFTYPAEFENPSGWMELGLIYIKWDGLEWKGLSEAEEYSRIDLEIPFITYYKMNYNDESETLSLLPQSELGGWLRYHYWDGKGWKGLGGTDKGSGILPSDILNRQDIGGFKPLNFPNSIIAMKLYSDKIQGLDKTNVMVWEDEVLPTIELFTHNFDHSLSAEDDAIMINGCLHNPFENPTNVNIVIAMLTPESDLVYFPSWSGGYSDIPLTLPAGFVLPWSELLSFGLPSESPPINQAGTYYFGMFLINPSNGEFYTYDIKQFSVGN